MASPAPRITSSEAAARRHFRDMPPMTEGVLREKCQEFDLLASMQTNTSEETGITTTMLYLRTARRNPRLGVTHICMYPEETPYAWAQMFDSLMRALDE